ncbi:MAG TPA: DedA family protein [Pyrinomonadaceae bacterium]|jgi:membrane protein DedA with SNARE-associated domain|nr:DedA family protein [Pyrinomonadaceae bacterium]
MNLTDQLLALVSTYGLPAFFAVIAIAAVGVPFPVTLTLVVAGSFVELGEMKLWQVIVVGSSAAILGDQIGYLIGRWGGHRIENRLRRTKSGAAKISRAHAFAQRWGAAGIFFSRWLITPLGPWLNLTSGMTDYPWRRFFLWDVLGETLWVVLYVMLGKIFSGSVQALADVLGNLAWFLVGIVAAAVLIWWLVKSLQNSESNALRKRAA